MVKKLDSSLPVEALGAQKKKLISENRRDSRDLNQRKSRPWQKGNRRDSRDLNQRKSRPWQKGNFNANTKGSFYKPFGKQKKIFIKNWWESPQHWCSSNTFYVADPQRAYPPHFKIFLTQSKDDSLFKTRHAIFKRYGYVARGDDYALVSKRYSIRLLFEQILHKLRKGVWIKQKNNELKIPFHIYSKQRDFIQEKKEAFFSKIRAPDRLMTPKGISLWRSLDSIGRRALLRWPDVYRPTINKNFRPYCPPLKLLKKKKYRRFFFKKRRKTSVGERLVPLASTGFQRSFLTQMAKNPFLLRRKAFPFIQDNLFRQRSSRVYIKALSIKKKINYPIRGFTQLWSAMDSYRTPFKSFDFSDLFERFSPRPNFGSVKFSRMQGRFFSFWYDFRHNKYLGLLEFGAKQKKLLSEKYLWLRQSDNSYNSFWSLLQRLPSFHLLKRDSLSLSKESILVHNNNFLNPLFPGVFSSSIFWFEEALPEVRLFGWNFYSRSSSVGIDPALSHSGFFGSLLDKKIPWTPSTIWLNSSCQDFSVLWARTSGKDEFIFPEKYFQFNRRKKLSRKFFTHKMNFLWSFFLQRTIQPFFSFPSVIFEVSLYLRLRLFFNFFFSLSNFSIAPSFFFTKNSSSRVSGIGNHWAFSVSVGFLKNLFRGYGRRRQLLRKIPSLFVGVSVFYRHFRKNLFRPFLLPLSFSHETRLKQLNFFFLLFFQQFSFKKPLSLAQLFFIWSFFFAEIRLASPDLRFYSRIISDRYKPAAFSSSFEPVSKPSFLSRRRKLPILIPDRPGFSKNRLRYLLTSLQKYVSRKKKISWRKRFFAFLKAKRTVFRKGDLRRYSKKLNKK